MDTGLEQLPTPPAGTKKCNKPWCCTWIPINACYGGCDSCRTIHSQNQRRYKQKKKATADDNTTTSSKRKQRPSLSSTNNRPAVRPRTDQSCEDDIQASLGADEEDSDDGRPWDDEEDEDVDKGGKCFSDAKSFFDTLRAEFRGGKAVDFSGSYTLHADPLVSPKKRIKMVAAEIWKVGGYRFTYLCGNYIGLKTTKRLKPGWSAQEKSKASQDPDVRNRDTLGMKRYRCRSKLAISCCTNEDDSQLTMSIQLRHRVKHTPYVDVAMPEAALDIIRKNAEWSTLVELVGKVVTFVHTDFGLSPIFDLQPPASEHLCDLTCLINTDATKKRQGVGRCGRGCGHGHGRGRGGTTGGRARKENDIPESESEPEASTGVDTSDEDDVPNYENDPLANENPAEALRRSSQLLIHGQKYLQPLKRILEVGNSQADFIFA
ncbi:hypothetical protein B0H17DRAFT_1144927 [Mycena rosella]|uniref:Uncharacterized protein n=1 Tax=Mycena rosella TaxID=1033263 RepID=A0AAD7G6G7_MYCRO|nr:hypothetical protein B0H17DRAFT_1144927 [Mycena rosella]